MFTLITAILPGEDRPYWAGIYRLYHAVDFTDTDVKDAMKLRLEMNWKGKNLSYMDAMGYTIASRLKIGFLTGGMEFEGLPNVEYVK